MSENETASTTLSIVLFGILIRGLCMLKLHQSIWDSYNQYFNRTLNKATTRTQR